MSENKTSPHGILIIISGPSGVGKTTIIQKMLTLFPQLSFVTTYTTRAARPHETDGVDYHFISKHLFLERKKQNFFLESVQYNDHWYGISWDLKTEIERGQSFIAAPDIRGMQEITSQYRTPDYSVWLTATPDILRKRLLIRGTESQASIEKRLEQAKKEELTVLATHLYTKIIENNANQLPAVIEEISADIALLLR